MEPPIRKRCYPIEHTAHAPSPLRKHLSNIHITLSPALVSLHLKLVTLSLQRNGIFPGEELSVCHVRKAAFRVAPTDTSRYFYGEYVELDMAVCKPVCLCTTLIEVHTDLCSGWCQVSRYDRYDRLQYAGGCRLSWQCLCSDACHLHIDTRFLYFEYEQHDSLYLMLDTNIPTAISFPLYAVYSWQWILLILIGSTHGTSLFPTAQRSGFALPSGSPGTVR